MEAHKRLVMASKLTSAPTLSRLMVLVSLLASCCLLAVQQTSAGQSSAEDDSFFKYMRPRLGYFSRYNPNNVYARSYEQYFSNVLAENDPSLKSLPIDDWRKVRPAGPLCIDFLTGLTVKSYIMSKPFEVIMLDACLDWLFDEERELSIKERETDLGRLDSERKSLFKKLKADTKLRQLYENTRMRDESGLPKELQDQIYEYIMRLHHVYKDNPYNGCHSLWLEAYNDFIDDVYVRDCEDDTNCDFFGIEKSQEDTYLNMIVESTKQASKACYHVMQKQIHGLLLTEFDQSNSGPTTLRMRLKGKSEVEKQSEKEKWAHEMISILQMASGVSQYKPVNLGDVANDLYAIKNGDKEKIDRFTEALNKYAMSNTDLSKTNGDQLGRARYGRAMMKLCRPYTNKKMFLAITAGINMDDDNEIRKPFEFYGLIYSLVRLTNHEQLFGITKDNFEDDVIKYHWEALYLATFTCQIISTTWSELSYDTNSGSFNVFLRPEYSDMIADWPIEVMNEKLPIMYHPNSREPAVKLKRVSSSSNPKFHFGSKFKLNFQRPKISSDGTPGQSIETPATFKQEAAPIPTPAPATLTTPSAAISIVAPNNKAPTGSINSNLPERKEPEIMSWETIEMYRDLHGRYPKLPAFYKDIYPQLPDDLTAVYPKKLGVPTSKTSKVATSDSSSFASTYRSGGFGGMDSLNTGPKESKATTKKSAINSLSSLTF